MEFGQPDAHPLDSIGLKASEHIVACHSVHQLTWVVYLVLLTNAFKKVSQFKACLQFGRTIVLCLFKKITNRLSDQDTTLCNMDFPIVVTLPQPAYQKRQHLVMKKKELNEEGTFFRCENERVVLGPVCACFAFTSAVENRCPF